MSSIGVSDAASLQREHDDQHLDESQTEEGTGDISAPHLDHINGEPDRAQEQDESVMGSHIAEESEDDGDLGLSQEHEAPPSPLRNAAEEVTTSETQARDEPKAKRGHNRIDSVPPKKYNLDSPPPSAVSRSPFVGNSLHEEDVEGESYEDEEAEAPSPRERSEIEDAGLDFVDIRLDIEGADQGHSPYGAGAAMASKSAVEIRQDSISSGSRAAKDVARAAEERRRTEDLLSNGSRDRTGPSSARSISPARVSVEGRYRGRRSASNSRAASPEPSSRTQAVGRSQTISTSSAHQGPPGVTMMLADENGELQVVDSPLSPSSKTTYSEVSLGGPEEQGERATSSELAQKTASEPPAPTPKPDQEHTKSEPSPKATEEEPQSSGQQDGSVEAQEIPNGKVAGLKDIADEDVKKARRRSKPSALEQHVSRTRMTTLPPKPKEEDVRHLSDFEAMMKSYREAEKKRAQEDEERRRKKDEVLSEAMHVWEKEILPSWTRARREHRLRQVWWRGAPPNLRGRVWALACGNAQMLPRNLFVQAGNAARKAQQDDLFPKADMIALEADIDATLPSLKLFQREGPLYQDLKDVLCAFVMVRLDSIGGVEAAARQSDDDGQVKVYQRGSASLVAMLLTNLAPNETLIALINLIADRPWLKALYALPPSTDLDPLAAGPSHNQPHIHTSTPRTPTKRHDAASGFERVFDTLLADQMPKVYANMQANGVRPSAYVRDWVRTLFVPFLSLEAVARLWDCILLEESGENGLIFRTGIAIVSLLSARLYVPDKKELITILRGNNRAALSVWHRSRALMSGVRIVEAPPSSPETPRSIEAEADMVPKDDVYGGQYGITEHSLFQALEEQQSWWKDSMLERLLDRELVNV